MNEATCSECGEPLETRKDNARVVRWGFWDADKQWFQRAPHHEHYCAECWRQEFQRPAAAHYEVEDGDRLWDMLAAADGRLVADLKPMFVGGRPWIRVVDDEVQVVAAHMRREEPGVLTNTVERHDADRDWFDNVFDGAGVDGNIPARVYLKPVDETPFDRYDSLDDYDEYGGVTA